MTAGKADLLQEHLAACVAQLAWCLVPHQPPPADLSLLARAMISDAAAAFDLPTDELPSAAQLLHEAQAQLVWRGEVDASEREEWQAERIQEAWAELLLYRELAEQE
ncbi:hypothetical protein ACIFOC_00481 [Leucobacter aridicollis]|uniref:hypothetical protein n=1 Tax=Leucobacter aridicollis TaxID=283878 RepID=UPI0037C9AE72